MQQFEHSIIVQPADIDAMNHVNNVVYVQWVQDAASEHWNTHAAQELMLRYNWVVLRHEIDYLGAAVLHDKLVARTWVNAYNGVRSTRIVQIRRQRDDKLLVEARTTWCLLASGNHRPVRIPEEIKALFKAASEVD
jgi:acyl-CoA thioester hydrolase